MFAVPAAVPVREPEKARDIRLRAETAAAHSDSGLVAEDRGDQPVGQRADVERDDADTVAALPELARPVDGHAGNRPQPLERVSRQRRLVARDASMPASISACAAAAIATAPTTFGLPASSRSGRPAQCTCRTSRSRPSRRPVLRLALRGTRRAADQRASAERRIHLVRRERDEVEMLRVAVRPDVDAPVRRKLRGIDENPRADGVRLSRETMDRLDEAGDVRGAADGQQPKRSP